MWYFLMPRQDGSIYSHAISSGNLLDAYHQFKQVWKPDLDWAIGVWFEEALVARIIPVTDADTNEVQPVILLIN